MMVTSPTDRRLEDINKSLKEINNTLKILVKLMSLPRYIQTGEDNEKS